MSNTQTQALVVSTLKLLTTEEKTRGEAIQSLVYLLVIADEEKALPAGFVLEKAYRHTEQTAQKTRNELLLTHLFHVMEQVQTEKGPKNKVKDNVQPSLISLLKARINRTLIVAAWIAKNGGTQSQMIRRNSNGLLSVRGKIYFTDKQIKDAPDLETNWVTLDGKSSAASGKYEVLATQSAKGLNWSKATSGTKVDHIAKAPISKLSETLEGKLNLVQSKEMLVGKMELKALRELWTVLGETIKYATKHIAPDAKTTTGEVVKKIAAKDKSRKKMTDAQIEAVKAASLKAKKQVQIAA